MIGILVASHGKLAEGLVNTSELIAGPSEKLEYMGLFHGDSVSEFEANMMKSIENLDDGDGVLIFVDFNGGSPGNCALKCMRSGRNMRIISGTNATMLIEGLYSRKGKTLDELCDICSEIGHDAIQFLHKEFEELMKSAAEDSGDDDDF